MNYFFSLKCKVWCHETFHVSNRTMYNAGTINYICAVNHRDLHVAKTYIEEPDPPAPLAFLQAANELMMRRTLHFPQTVREAMSVYAELVTVMDDY